MKYNQPYGTAEDTAYANGDPSIGRAGSIPPAEAIEYPQRELLAMLTNSGLTPTNSDLQQLAKAIQNGYINYGADNGTVNSLNVTLPIAPILQAGLTIRVKVKFTNTGPSVIVVNGQAAKSIVRKGGVPILANDLVADYVAELVYNGVAFQLIGVGGSGARGELTSNKDIYVNYAIGNDSNDGTANDASHALKNIQPAINLAFYYAPSQFSINIHVADSLSYSGFGTPAYSGPTINVIGNETTPANVLVTGNNAHSCVVNGVNTMNVRGLKGATTTSTGNRWGGFIASNAALLGVYNCASGNLAGPVFEGFSGTVVIEPNFKLSGNCDEVFWGMRNGNISIDDNVVFDLTQDITVALATCYVAQGGSYAHGTNPAPVFNMNGHTITGKRYLAGLCGTINVLGGGEDFFPGTIAGTKETGGQYAP